MYPKQPRTSYPFYKFFYTFICAKICDNFAFIATGRDCTKTRRRDAFFFPKRKEAAIKTTFIFTRYYIQERSRFFWLLQLAFSPPIYLHLIFVILQFELSSSMIWIFTVHISNMNFTNCSRQKIPVQTRKKHPVHQTQYFKLEHCKNQVQIDRRNGCTKMGTLPVRQHSNIYVFLKTIIRDN